MFDDENSNSHWHSDLQNWNTVKTLTIKFFNPIIFQYLRVLKRNDDARAINAYSNYCLVLNNDETNQLCTDQPKGFSDSDDESVQWTLPSNFVTKVKLVNRHVGSDLNGLFGIRDLKIFYTDSPSPLQFSGECLQNSIVDGVSILKNLRLRDQNDLTIEKCLDACKYEKYAGIGQGMHCNCGDEFATIDILPETSCDVKCKGDNTQNCGGNLVWNVHSIQSPQKFTGECTTAYEENDGGPITVLFKKFSSTLTPQICLDRCQYFKYAGLGNGDNCFCVENLPKLNFLPESECNTPCIGDSSDYKCGGPMKWSVYSIEEPKPFTGQCIKDYYPGIRILGEGVAVDGLTVEKCLESCKNHKYAGVQNGNGCHCAKEFARGLEILADSDCDMACVGDQTQICGGSNKMNIYTV